jgi:thioredoxin 1
VSHSDIVHTTDAAFERDVLASDKPVLVDFWAEWCGPCRAIGPLVDEIAQERRDSLRVVKVNVDDAPGIARKFGIRGIPTLILFKQGSIVAQQVGALRKPELADFLDSDADAALPDIASTLFHGRTHFAHRRVVAARDRAQAVSILRATDRNAAAAHTLVEKPSGVVFLFPGGGAKIIPLPVPAPAPIQETPAAGENDEKKKCKNEPTVGQDPILDPIQPALSPPSLTSGVQRWHASDERAGESDQPLCRVSGILHSTRRSREQTRRPQKIVASHETAH